GLRVGAGRTKESDGPGSMGILIDTSVLIESERGRIDLDAHVNGREDVACFLSVITVSELLHGVHRASDPKMRAKRSAWVEAILSQFPILEIDLATARAHAQIWAERTGTGEIIGPHDLWLAATCIAHGLRIVTANEREFARVPGLEIELW